MTKTKIVDFSNYVGNQFLIAIRSLGVCGIWPIYQWLKDHLCLIKMWLNVPYGWCEASGGMQRPN
jgi:hypothetical protein